MALDEPNNWISLILGFLLTALGLIPILNNLGVIGFALPGFMTGLFGSLFALFVIAGGGAYLLIDSFFEDDAIFWITFVTSIAIIGLGIIPILSKFGVIGLNFSYAELIYQIIYVIEGFLLVVAAFVMN